MKLLRPPRPPSWSPQIVVRMREDDPQEWKLWMPRSKKLAGKKFRTISFIDQKLKFAIEVPDTSLENLI